MYGKKTVYLQLKSADNKAILEIPEIRPEALFRAFYLSGREDGKTEIVFSVTFQDKIVNSPLAAYESRREAEKDLASLRESFFRNAEVQKQDDDD